MRPWLKVAVAAAALLAQSCIVEAPTGKKGGSSQMPAAPGADVEEGQVAQAAAAVPPMAVKSGANIGNKVEITGAMVMPGALIPGGQVRVAIFFKVLEAMTEDYSVFVHLEDVDGRVERMNVDHKPNNGQTPTNTWKKGDTVKDEFGLYLPPGLPVRGLNVYVGLWEPNHDVRLKVVNPDAVKTDGNDRVLLVTIPAAR